MCRALCNFLVAAACIIIIGTSYAVWRMTPDPDESWTAKASLLATSAVAGKICLRIEQGRLFYDLDGQCFPVHECETIQRKGFDSFEDFVKFVACYPRQTRDCAFWIGFGALIILLTQLLLSCVDSCIEAMRKRQDQSVYRWV